MTRKLTDLEKIAIKRTIKHSLIPAPVPPEVRTVVQDDRDEGPFHDVGTRMDETGLVRDEYRPVDVMFPTKLELGEPGVPAREERTSQQIHEELLPGWSFGQPCFMHGTPGCTTCQSYRESRRFAKNRRVIQDWWMNHAPDRLIISAGNETKILKYVGEQIHPDQPVDLHLDDITSDALTAAALALIDVLDWSDDRANRGRPIVPTAPIVLHDRKPTVQIKPPTKRGRPRKVEDSDDADDAVKRLRRQENDLRSLRKEAGLSRRELSVLLDDPKFNPLVSKKDWSVLSTDKSALRCLMRLSKGQVGSLHGKRITRACDFTDRLPDITGRLFPDGEIRFYKDFASDNYSKNDLKCRLAEGQYGQLDCDNLLVLENKFIVQLRKVGLVKEDQRAGKDLETALDEERDKEIAGIKSGAINAGNVVGKFNYTSGKTGQYKKLNSFEIGWQTRFRKGWDGDSAGSSGPDYEDCADDQESPS